MGTSLICSRSMLQFLLDRLDPLAQGRVGILQLHDHRIRGDISEILPRQLLEGRDQCPAVAFLDSLLVGCRVAKNMNIPFYAALTFEKSGRTMMGNTVEQACRELEKAGASAVGMNCSLGPDMAVPIIREFTKHTELPLLFKPNAGLPITAPDGTVTAPYTAKMFVDEIKPALEFVTFVGGCCNTDFEYVKLLKTEVDALRKED